MSNKAFKEELKKYQANQNAVDFLDAVLVDYTRLSAIDKTKRLEQLGTEIKTCQTRINAARQLMLDGKLDAQEYREIKNDYDGQLRKLEAKITDIGTMDSDLKDKLIFCRQVLVSLVECYENADLIAIQQLVSSIYPEKLVMDDYSVRTTRLNEAIAPICRTVAGFSGTKNDESSENSELSNLVPGTGIFKPWLLIRYRRYVSKLCRSKKRTYIRATFERLFGLSACQSKYKYSDESLKLYK